MKHIKKISKTMYVAVAIVASVAMSLAFSTLPVAADDVSIALSPQTASNPVGTNHTVTATVSFDAGFVEPIAFQVVSGPNTGQTGICSSNSDCSLDANKQVSWTYAGTGGAGVDTIEACAVNVIGEFSRTACNTATKEWVGSTVFPGRMTGGGTVGDSTVRHGFEMHCDTTSAPNNLEINWGKGERFHLESLTTAACSDDPAIAAKPPRATFDTHHGTGMGRYNGATGATAEWVLTDAGEPGRQDVAHLMVKDKHGSVVLNVQGALQKGTHQAHR